MKFAYPEFLSAFGVLLLPIIIHLFNFKRYKTIYFSSLQFVKHVEKETKSTQKLKHILVLLARLLAFSALILAFAQPYIPNEQTSSLKSQPVLAIYIDNSFSMSANGTNGKLLNQARETARKLIDNSPPGTNFMLVTNELSGQEQRLVSRTEVLERLDLIDYSSIRRNTGSIINTIHDALNLANFDGSKQLVLLSDFQKNTTLFDKVKSDPFTTLYPLQLNPQQKNNIYIDSIWFDSPIRKINTNNTLNIRIKNTAQEAMDNIPLTLVIGDYKRELLVDLNEDLSTITTVNYTDKTTGFKSGYVRLFEDQIDFDNTFYFSYNVAANSTVLIINGERANNHPSLVFKTDDYFKVIERAEKQFQLNELKESKTLVLNNLNSFSTGLITQIKDFISNGGSVFIIPAANLDKGSYNRLLGKLSLPLIGTFYQQALRINKIEVNDPFFNGVFDKTTRKIALPMTKSYYSGQFSTNTNAKSLISFENGNPFFVKQTRQGKAYSLYASTDTTFGKISEHALFSSLLLRAGELSQDQTNLSATLGKTDHFKLFRPNGSEKALHIINKDIDFIPPFIHKDNYSILSFNETSVTEYLSAGNYLIQEDKSILSEIGVNYNRDESDITPISKEELHSLLEESGLNYENTLTIENFQDIEQLSLEKPLEYWRILLILSAVFLLIEILLLTLWKV